MIHIKLNRDYHYTMNRRDVAMKETYEMELTAHNTYGYLRHLPGFGWQSLACPGREDIRP